MKIWSNTNINKDGIEYVIIEINCKEDLFIKFTIDHNKHKTIARWDFWYKRTFLNNGYVGSWGGCWTKNECLEFCKEKYEKQQN